MLPAAGCPPARLAVAGAAQGVAAAVGAALAGELAEPSPVVGVAGAVAAHGVAAPVGVARAALLAVVAPVLLGAACGGKGHSQDGEKPGSPPEHPAGFKGGWEGAERGGDTHGNCSLLRRSRACSGRARVSGTPRPPCRRPPPRTRLSGQEKALSTLWPLKHSQGNHHPASPSIPPAQPQHHQQLMMPPRGRIPLARLEQSCRAAPITERIRLDQRGDHALGFIPTHHSPTVHSLPSCFQPGQHARPAGNLRERPGGVSQGQGGFMASAKAKRSLPQC